MKIISHRGNIEGPNIKTENHPDQIRLAISLGFDAEIDVWRVGSLWMLGHDNPDYSIDESFFNSNMWIHCKNFEAVSEMFKKPRHFNFFWHENDKMTLTNKQVPWCYPGHYVENGITVSLDGPVSFPVKVAGVCTDFPDAWSKN